MLGLIAKLKLAKICTEIKLDHLGDMSPDFKKVHYVIVIYGLSNPFWKCIVTRKKLFNDNIAETNIALVNIG